MYVIVEAKDKGGYYIIYCIYLKKNLENNLELEFGIYDDYN